MTGIVGASVAGVGKFVVIDGVGTLVVGCWACIDGIGVLFLVFRWWICGAVRMASGAVGSTDVVGVLPTLEVRDISTLEDDAGSTLEGGMHSICSGIHLFRLGVWCSVRTLVNKRKIMQWFCF